VRTPFVVRSFMRGGHGWERPDVPLSEPYVNRRHVHSRNSLSTIG
jgi:hypothetical protein